MPVTIVIISCIVILLITSTSEKGIFLIIGILFKLKDYTLLMIAVNRF